MASKSMLQRCVGEAICGFMEFPASGVDGNGWDQWKAEMRRGPSPSYELWEEAVKRSCNEVAVSLSVEQQRVLGAETDADLEPLDDDDDPRPESQIWVEILAGQIYKAVCILADQEAENDAARLDGVAVFDEASWAAVETAKRAVRSLLGVEGLAGAQIERLGKTLRLVESMPEWEVEKYIACGVQCPEGVDGSARGCEFVKLELTEEAMRFRVGVGSASSCGNDELSYGEISLKRLGEVQEAQELAAWEGELARLLANGGKPFVRADPD
jgi:hypothetical protein